MTTHKLVQICVSKNDYIMTMPEKSCDNCTLSYEGCNENTECSVTHQLHRYTETAYLLAARHARKIDSK
jgi:hypothetical protein